MTSKEALSDLLNMADYCLEEDERKQIKKEYKIVLKDLEVLEILKEYIKINDCKFANSNKSNKCIIMFIPEMVEDYRVIKEWIENVN